MKCEKIVLDNGLRIIFEENPTLKSCYMGIWVGSGSCYESEETSGISHFIEHMVFKGTKTRSSEQLSREADMMGGALNAYTDKECTCFYSRALKKDAPKALDLICDMLKNPRLDENDIELEKGVVKEEIAMYESTPTDLCMDTFYLETYKGDALGRNVLGTRETVSSFTAQMIREHMRKYYAPNRMVVCFAGAFDEKDMIDVVKKYFSASERSEEEILLPVPTFKSGITCLNKDFEQNCVTIAFDSVDMKNEDRFAYKMMGAILGGSTSSRLFRRVREDMGLVYSIDAYLVSFVNSGSFNIVMSVSPENEKKAVELAVETVKSFADTVTQDELDLARAQGLAAMMMSLESSGSRASKYAISELLLNKKFDENELEKRVNEVTLEDIKKAARTITDFSKCSVCAVGKTAGENFYNKVVR